jgi:hypothetical protein
MTKSNEGYVEDIQFENGGQWIERSKATHVSFNMDFPVQDSSTAVGLEGYQRYADGEYGDGYMYFVDPMAQDQNLFSPNWAAPGLSEQGWKRIYDTTPSYSDTATNTFAKPTRKATYNITSATAGALPAAANGVFTFIVPNDCTLYLGGSGALTGNAVLRAQAYDVGSGLTNFAQNPSPQDATQLVTGWGAAAATGGTITSGRVAGIGVNGGFGFRATYTTSSTAASGYAVYGRFNATDTPVTPGQSITPSIYVGSSIAQSFRILTRFYDSANAQVGGNFYSATTYALIANAPLTRMVGEAITVPATAVRVFIAADVTGAAGGVNWTGTRTNLSTNPSSEVTANMGNNAGTGGTSAVTRETTGGYVGTSFSRITWSAATTVTGTAGSSVGGGPLNNGGAVAISPSTVYTVSAYVRSSKATVIQPRVDFTGSVTVNTQGSPVSVAANVWTRVSVVNANSGAGNTNLSFQIYAGLGSTNPSWAIGDTLDVDAVLVEQTATLGSYFDGATSDVNLLTNSSFETDTAGYTTGANVTLVRSTASAYVGNASGLMTALVTSGSGTTVDRSYTTTVGQVYTASAWMKSASGARQINITSSGTVQSSSLLTSNSTWQRVYVTVVAVSTTTTFNIRMATAGAIGDAIYIDAVQLETGQLSDWSDYNDVTRTYAWTGTANASTSTRSGDTMTIDRVSTAPGAYFDGSAEFPGTVWNGTAYASTSTQTSALFDITLTSDATAPAFSRSFDGAIYKTVRVYLTRTALTASTATLTALWAQIIPTAQTSVINRHIPGKGFTGLRFSTAVIPETYVMAGRHLTGMSFGLSEVEAWAS